MKGSPIKHSEVNKFILAGKAIVTFLNTKTDNRFTFKIKKSKDNESLFFVSILINTESYQYIGTLNNNNFKFGRKSKISNESQSVRVFEYIFNKIKTNTLPDFIEIWHEGKCGRCGRALTVPSSIESGLGPECYRRIMSPIQMKRQHALKLILK